MTRITPKFLEWFSRNYTLPDFSRLTPEAQERILHRYERLCAYYEKPEIRERQRKCAQNQRERTKQKQQMRQ